MTKGNYISPVDLTVTYYIIFKVKSKCQKQWFLAPNKGNQGSLEKQFIVSLRQGKYKRLEHLLVPDGRNYSKKSGAKSVDESLRRNRTFAPSQSISTKIFINYKGKNCNFTMDKSDTHHPNQVIEVNITPKAYCFCSILAKNL